MQNIGAVSSNNSVGRHGAAGGTTSASAGAQQTSSDPGGFEGILEQLAGLLSADQTDPSDDGGDSGDSQQSSQNSKQIAGQFSQLPNGKILMGSTASASGSVSVSASLGDLASSDIAGQTSSAQAGGASQKQVNQDPQKPSQDSASSRDLDSFMVAAAAAAAQQGQAVPTPASAPAPTITNTTSAPVSTVSDTSTASIPQNPLAVMANSLAQDSPGAAADADKNMAGVSALTSAAATGAEKSTADVTQKTASSPHSSGAATESSDATTLSSQLQAGSESVAAIMNGQAKKSSTAVDSSLSSGKEAKNSTSASLAGLKENQAGNSSSRNEQAAAGTDSIVEQVANASQSSDSSASLTMQELSAMQAVKTKKADDLGKTGTSSDAANFSTAARAEFQISTPGSGERAIASDPGTPGGTNPFGVLDSAPTASEQQGQLLRATHKEVEVGLQDPQYGWIEVKTQMHAGQVAASLSVASPEAQHALQQELPAMQHFVASRDLDLSSLSVSTGTDGGSGAFNHQSGQGTGDQNQPFNQISVGEVWGGQPSSKPSTATAAEKVWMPETASRISVMA